MSIVAGDDLPYPRTSQRRRSDGCGLRLSNPRCSACSAASSMRSASGGGRPSSMSTWSKRPARHSGELLRRACEICRRCRGVHRVRADHREGIPRQLRHRGRRALTSDRRRTVRLIRSRLLRIEDHHGAQWIELTHDVLTGVVREHRDRRRAEAEKAALAARAEQEKRPLRKPPSGMRRTRSRASGRTATRSSQRRWRWCASRRWCQRGWQLSARFLPKTLVTRLRSFPQ